MTIKKKSKEKVDGEKNDLSPRSPPSQIQIEVNNRGLGRNRTASRQNEGADEYDIHPTTSHSKRRHRSSPHRTFRKLRGECHNLGHRDREPHRQPKHRAMNLPSNHGIENNLQGPLENILSNLSHLSGASSSPVQPGISVEEGGNNSEDEYNPVLPSEFNFPGCEQAENYNELDILFEKALKDKRGFIIKHMATDGACLFRAVADQIYGDPEMHACVRQCVVEYMAKNSDFFKHYVTEDFNTYLQRKLLDSSHGNHIEIQAMCEMYSRPIEVYQYSLDPINIFQGAYAAENEPIRISYHQNTHYNSVYDPYKATIGVGLGLPGHKPGAADKNLMQEAKTLSENSHIEKTMMEDKLKETDWEVTQETIEEQVARESYLQWLRDNEKRAAAMGSGSATSATCSSSASAAGSSIPQSSAADSRPHQSCTATRPPNSPVSMVTRGGVSSRSPCGSQSNSPPGSPHSLSAAETTGPLPLQPELNLLSMSPELPQDLALNLNPIPLQQRSPCGEYGAMGGGASPSREGTETASIMNEFIPHCFGISEWNDTDILAQVIAQSQQEYLDHLKSSNVKHTGGDSPSRGQTSSGSKSGSNEASTSKGFS